MLTTPVIQYTLVLSLDTSDKLRPATKIKNQVEILKKVRLCLLSYPIGVYIASPFAENKKKQKTALKASSPTQNEAHFLYMSVCAI